MREVVVFCCFLLTSMASDANAEPAAVVRSFHEALTAGDREGVIALLHPKVVIFEQGGAEMSRDEYTSQHLDADIEFSRATIRKVIEQRAQTQGKTAWVLTVSQTEGSFRGKDVASRTVETMVLEKSARAWRIVHIHWSSHREK